MRHKNVKDTVFIRVLNKVEKYLTMAMRSLVLGFITLTFSYANTKI